MNSVAGGSGGVLTKLVNSIPEMLKAFGEVLVMSPQQALLVLIGGLLIAISVGLLGYLTLGALLSPIGGLPSPGRGQGN